ncbi:MAG: PilZ domain-containing protein [Deltaproteobacteria bacterium]|nr:PilZ domain-containing protein [Deltaproteobacteria bacterium]
MNKAVPGTESPTDQDIPVLSDDDAGLIITCDEPEPIVRKSFRVPLDKGVVTCAVKGKSYNAVDLSMYGLGLEVPDPEEFRIGEDIPSVSIQFSDKSFLVDVRVVHISPHGGDSLICGMQIVHTHDAGYVDWMTRVIAEMKAAMLTIKDVFK